MQELVSIIMPVFNAAEFLEDCIESILQQTYQTWELLAVNDHSTDGSLEILQKFEKLDNRIIAIHQDSKPKGIIPSLQLGYQFAKGAYITRMDADDLMEVSKLERLHQILRGDTFDLAIGLVKYFSNQTLGNGFIEYEKWLNGLTQAGQNFKEIYKECTVPSPAWMMRKDDFDRIGAFDSQIYPEDYDLCFRMYQNKLVSKGTQTAVHFWRDYPTRTSRVDENYADHTFLDLKMKYFIDLDLAPKKKLVLWGAGKKAKRIAQILNQNETHFEWICNNQKKIGHVIHKVLIKDTKSHTIEPSNQYILTVANKEEQAQILDKLYQEKVPDISLFWMC